MKAIQTRLNFNTFRTRQRDNCLGFSGETVELTNEEMLQFMEIRGTDVDALLKPLEGFDGIVEVKGEKDAKTPSQRLRSVLFILWKQTGEQGTFSNFYDLQMEKFINLVKSKLEEE